MRSRMDAMVASLDTNRKPRNYRQAIGEAATAPNVCEKDRKRLSTADRKHVLALGLTIPDGYCSWKDASGGNTGIAQKQNATDALKMRDNTRTGRPGRIIV
jgi:hypothetical protein